MADDYSMYHAMGTNQPGPDPNQQYQPPTGQQQYQHNPPYHSPPPGQQQFYGGPPAGGVPPNQSYGQPPPPQGGQDYLTGPAGVAAPPPADGGLAAQMGGLSVADQNQGTVRKKKKDRHAYHMVEAPAGSSQAFNGMPSPPGSQPGSAFGPIDPVVGSQFLQGAQPSPGLGGSGQFPAPAAPGFHPTSTVSPAEFAARNGTFAPGAPDQGMGVPTQGAAAPGGGGRVSPEDMPSVPVSRDAPQQFYNSNVYPTFARHVPPPATVSFVAFDQGNSSPKFTRLTLNCIPSSTEGLASTGLPLGLMLQPLAPLQPGEQAIPVLDFGEQGPPRCRRCRAYINPFMMFRQGGNKFVCNLCTYPNDTPAEYFCATSPQGVRVDRDQRPELTKGTVEFVVPKEYWTKEPVGIRWLFLIDVTQESVNKGFLEAFCEGILSALYSEADDKKADGEDAGEENAEVKRSIPKGAKVGFVTFDKDIHFYNVNPALEQAQMMIMPDIEDPFVPLSEGLFVDPYESK